MAKQVLAVMTLIILVMGILVYIGVHYSSKRMKHNETKYRDAGVEYVIDKERNLCFAWHSRFRKGGLTRVPCEALK